MCSRVLSKELTEVSLVESSHRTCQACHSIELPRKRKPCLKVLIIPQCVQNQDQERLDKELLILLPRKGYSQTVPNEVKSSTQGQLLVESSRLFDRQQTANESTCSISPIRAEPP